MDSLLRRVYGKQKQGAGFGHAKVGGYQVLLPGLNPLVATISTPGAAPLIAATQLRAGNAGSARGAAALIAEAVATTKAVIAARPATAATTAAAVAAEIIVRADPAFYSRAVITACRRARVRFSVTVRIDAKVRAAIAAISEDAWTEIRYPQPVWDEDQQRFISRPHIAETTYTAFEGTSHEVTARLIARRVPELRNPQWTIKVNCSPSGVTTPRSPTARTPSSRPKPSTAATPSSNTSSEARPCSTSRRRCPPQCRTR
ncbi:transposase [Dactylosporangium sp. NPDC000244]|uniref:transposase n=1 Tax=Dactylosporangium sp. NPDC000244 TaxID=3154365 RepID=UPI003331B15F